MKSVAAILFAGLAAAVPVQKRGVSTVVVVETVFQTSTKWVDANAAAYTPPSNYAAHTVSSSVSAYATPSSTSTSSFSSVTTTPSSSSSSVPSSSTTASTSSSITTTSSSILSISTSIPVVTSTSSSSSVYVPSSTSSSAAPSSTAPSGDGSAYGPTYSGDITYYTPGTGSCGLVNSSSDPIVAISHVIMEAAGVANPNKNPNCGRRVKITYGGVDTIATVTDTCPGCTEGSLDLTESLFYAVAPSGDGRVHDVSWCFIDPPQSY